MKEKKSFLFNNSEILHSLLTHAMEKEQKKTYFFYFQCVFFLSPLATLHAKSTKQSDDNIPQKKEEEEEEELVPATMISLRPRSDCIIPIPIEAQRQAAKSLQKAIGRTLKRKATHDII